MIKLIKKNGKKIYKFLNKIEAKLKQNLILNSVENLDQLDSQSYDVALYMSGGQQSAYQANMWLKVLENIDAKVIIVLREYSILYELHKTTIPIYVIHKFSDLEKLESAKIKTILYPANPQKVTQSLRLYRLNHYFINHGESDKVVNQSKLLMAYDKILVSGELAEKRLYDANLPIRKNQIVHVGRPLVEFLLEKENKSDKLKIDSILYAPTWEGFVEEANYSSINSYGICLVKELVEISKNKKIYFKPHPFIGKTKRNSITKDYNEIKQLIKNSNIEFIEANESIYDYMNKSDILITDISSIITDYLYTNKPMILTNAKKHNREYLNKTFLSTQALSILDNPEEILSIINSIEINDPLKKKREEMEKTILGNIKEGYFNKFNSVINKSLNLK